MDSSALDPQISNGTCYSAPGLEAHSRYIPCGNSAFGHIPCCESADVCLSSLACYNGQHGVTYLAGCTDPTYEDNNCPDKEPYSNQSWVGLSYCGDRIWVGCANPPASQMENLATVVHVPSTDCSCSDTTMQPQFTDANILANYLSLPTAIGLSYSWGGGLTTNAYQSATTPTATSLSTSSSSSSSSSSMAPSTTASTSETSVQTSTDSSSAPASTSVTMSSSSVTETSSASSSTPTDDSVSSQPSVSTVAGAATGSAVGFILLVAAIAALWFYRFRKKRRAAAVDGPLQEKSTRAESNVYTDDIVGYNSNHGGGGGGGASPSYHSELPADSIASPSLVGSSTFVQSPIAKSEVEGSPVPGPRKAKELPGGGYEVVGQRDTYYEMSA